jgi:hypothetical protein
VFPRDWFIIPFPPFPMEKGRSQADTNQRTSYVEISYRLNSSSARVGIPFVSTAYRADGSFLMKRSSLRYLPGASSSLPFPHFPWESGRKEKERLTAASLVFFSF